MTEEDKVNILLVDDQPAKLLAYEVILKDLGETLLKASSAREALENLLKTDVAVVLIDVCMPELDGFELAAMIREHPRFQRTAIIFISAVQFTDIDRLRGYQMGAVDYVPVPVVPEVLRAKIKIFTELYRKTRQLEVLNKELEARVRDRTAELEAAAEGLRNSERRRSLALAAGQMGSWDWDLQRRVCHWDEGQYGILGLDPQTFVIRLEAVKALVEAEDWARLEASFQTLSSDAGFYHEEIRIRRPSGELRWCTVSATPTFDAEGKLVRMVGITADITERKLAEQRQALLAREVDHRARNALAIVQSIVRLTRAPTTEAYVSSIEGRIKSLSRVHSLLSQSRWQGADLGKLVEDELAPFRSSAPNVSASGPSISLRPAAAQALALTIHELVTNAAKYGALSSRAGELHVQWALDGEDIVIAWSEISPEKTGPPASQGFGSKVIKSSVEQQLGGVVAMEWRANGLYCTLRVPQRRGVAEHEPALEVPPAVRNRDSAPQLSAERMRVLMVEDEPLVALMMQDLLQDLGVDVVGPYGDLSAAIAAARTQNFDSAILDVNLGGTAVYPLASVLTESEIPFAFITGYDPASIDRQFCDVPIFQKPIERQNLTEILATLTHGARRRERRSGQAGARLPAE